MGNDIVKIVKLAHIKPNLHQPRKSFDKEKLEELAASIKEQGIIQPLIVEELSENNYQIIAGERRYRAAILTGAEEVPVIVRKFNTLQKMQIAIIENVQREELNPIEEAYAYVYLIQEGQMTQEEIAKKIGKSRSAIANSVRLINLPEKMIDSMLKKEITSGHARALLSVNNPADRDYLFKEMLEKKLNVRDSEYYANMLNNGGRASSKFDIKKLSGFVLSNESNIEEKEEKDKKIKISAEELIHIKECEKKISRIVNAKVKLKGNLSCGKITINYISYDDLEKIYRRIGGSDKLVEDEE